MLCVTDHEPRVTSDESRSPIFYFVPLCLLARRSLARRRVAFVPYLPTHRSGLATHSFDYTFSLTQRLLFPIIK